MNSFLKMLRNFRDYFKNASIEFQNNYQKISKDVIKNFAFTLTEILIALGIVGVLVAILLPIIKHLMPHEEIVMAKRATYAVQHSVSDLLNNEGCYPNNLDDGYGYDSCAWGKDIETDTIEEEGDLTEKFTTLFMEKMGFTPDSGITKLSAGTFYTTDDKISYAVKTKSVPENFVIAVDIDGAGKGNNCSKTNISSYNFTGVSTCSSSQTPDVFTIFVSFDGNVTINPDDSWAADAVKVGSKVINKQ